MAVDITWLFGFSTFKEARSNISYGANWFGKIKSFKDFHDRFSWISFAAGSGANTYPIISAFTIGNKRVKGFGSFSTAYCGYQFINALRKDPNKRTYFGYRLTAKWRAGNLFEFNVAKINKVGTSTVLDKVTVNEIGVAGATTSLYIEQTLEPDTSSGNHIYKLFINGVLFRTGVVTGIVNNPITPYVGPNASATVFNNGLNFIISDCYEGEQEVSEEVSPFGSLEVTGYPVTNISNDKAMTLQGSTATNVVEEMNFFWDDTTLQDKTSSVMLSNMGTENIISFEEVSSSVVGATIRSSYNRGNSANGRVSLTPITSAGLGESSVFTPPTENAKDFEIVTIPLKGELTPINVNAFKIKVETVK